MKVYCMCIITGQRPDPPPLDNQVFAAPNRYGPIRDQESDYDRSLHLRTEMRPVKLGLLQYVQNNGKPPPRNEWPDTQESQREDREQLVEASRHYPNVDLRRCPHCGAEVVVES